MPAQTILVTGGTGYLGSHIVSQLLASGFSVRATARSASKLRTIFPETDSANNRLVIVEVPDLTADHTQVLEDVDALIHCGSPTFFRGEALKKILEGAYHGAVDIIETAIKLGVKKIIYTSTLFTLLEPGFSNGYGTIPIGTDTWGSLPLEKIDLNPSTSPGQAYVYQTAKTAAEKKIWEMADQHPEIDFTAMLPSMLWGPFVPNFVNTLSASPGSLGTVSIFRDILDKDEYPQGELGAMVDVRDAARAHVLALDAPPLSLRDDGNNSGTKQRDDNKRQRKRLIITPENFKWEEVVKILRKEFAGDEGLLKRLPSEEAAQRAGKQMNVPYDTSLAEKTLGFGNYLPFEETVLETFKDVTLWENRIKV